MEPLSKIYLGEIGCSCLSYPRDDVPYLGQLEVYLAATLIERAEIASESIFPGIWFGNHVYLGRLCRFRNLEQHAFVRVYVLAHCYFFDVTLSSVTFR